MNHLEQLSHVAAQAERLQETVNTNTSEKTSSSRERTDSLTQASSSSSNQNGPSTAKAP
jgi:hypothetical protein